MDNIWKNKFEDAEIQPRKEVWEGIESRLDNGNGKRIGGAFLAWAAVVATAFAASIVFWNVDSTETNSKSEILSQNGNNQESILDIVPEKESAEEIILSENPKGEQLEKFTNELVASNLPNANNGSLTKTEEETRTNSPDEETELGAISPRGRMNGIDGFPNILPVNSILIVNATKKDEMSLAELRAEQEFQEYLKKVNSKTKKRRLWAGISQGIGSFSSGFGGADETSTSLNFEQIGDEYSLASFVDTQQNASNIQEDYSISTGVALGIPIGKELTLITGFNYCRNYFSDEGFVLEDELVHFTADRVSFSGESAELSREKLKGIYNIGIVPILLDYPLTANKLKWSVQAGPEIGIFMGHELKSSETGITRNTSSGDLYRPYHLRAALGTTLNYQMGSNYYLALQPVIEKTMTSMTKSDAAFSSQPLNYSVMLSLRYQFD